MIRALPLAALPLAALALLLGGCPTIGDTLPFVPLGDGGADLLAFEPPDVGRPDATRDARPAARPDARLPDAAARDRGVPDRDVDGGVCPPGTRLGPCAVCGPNGQPVAPDDDDACPEPDCSIYTYYEREEDGGYAQCWGEHWYPTAGRCRALGECHDDPDEYCDDFVYALEAEVEPSACQTLEGCFENVPPVVVVEPEGTRCNDFGLCTAQGTCTANPACGGFVLPGESFYCDARDGARPYCEFYLGAPMAIDCASFCGQHGWRCEAAWNSMVGMCLHEDLPAACGQPFDSFVCRCAPDD